MLLIVAQQHKSLASPVTEESAASATAGGDGKLLVISEDVIPDVIEMDQKKVIRVNPLDLPPIKEDPDKMSMDSSLYKIQSIKPKKTNKRRYVNSQNMRKPKPQAAEEATGSGSKPTQEDSQIVQAIRPAEQKFVKPKHQPKKKHLHFLYNQGDLSGNTLTKTMPVHTAPGAYPVFYAVARTNGRFGKYPLKSFSTPEAFTKYLHKKKIATSATTLQNL